VAGRGQSLHRLDPMSLLLLAPHLTFASSWGSQTLAAGVVLRGGRDVDLYELDANIPASLLQQFVPVRLAGEFSLQVEHLELRAGLPVQAGGRLVWQNGVWLAPAGPVPLGSYAMDFSQLPGAPLAGEVLTIAGPVTATGAVQLQDRTYMIDVAVQGEGPLDERLQQALSLLARPEGDGYRIKLDGEF
jgi:general secretion pathway protein N